MQEVIGRKQICGNNTCSGSNVYIVEKSNSILTSRVEEDYETRRGLVEDQPIFSANLTPLFPNQSFL